MLYKIVNRTPGSTDLFSISYTLFIIFSLSAGLLACYEPKIRGMDLDNPNRFHIKSSMERYKQMLSSVLQDYTIGSNDWAHVISTPKLWGSFMNQVYTAFIDVSATWYDVNYLYIFITFCSRVFKSNEWKAAITLKVAAFFHDIC